MELRPGHVTWGKVVVILLEAGWRPPSPTDEVVDNLAYDIEKLHHLKTLTLSSKQLQVFSLAAQGFTDAEIATKQGISTETVKTHKSQAFQKLGVRNTAQAVYELMKEGLIE